MSEPRAYVTLGELADLNPESLGAKTSTDHMFKYIDLTSVSHGSIDMAALAQFRFIDAPSRARRVVRDGDVLFGTVRPRLRSHARVAGHGYVASTGFCVTRARPGVADGGFLGHFLLSDEATRQAIRREVGSNYPAVTERDVGAFRLPRIPLKEQRRIAEVLDTIDEAIQATERVITKLIRIRRGQVDDLLGPLPLNSSLGSGLERIDAGWSPACVDRPPMEQEWGVLKVSSITTEEFDPSESKTIPTTLRYRPQLMVKVGDVLTARANGVADLVARTAIVDYLDHKNLMISDKTLRLVTRATLSARYLTYCMQHEMVRHQVRGFVSGSTGQGNISQQELHSLRLAIPGLQQQMDIEQAVTAIDARIVAERSRNRKLRELRSGLSSDLLSGRVRTVAA